MKHVAATTKSPRLHVNTRSTDQHMNTTHLYIQHYHLNVGIMGRLGSDYTEAQLANDDNALFL